MQTPRALQCESHRPRPMQTDCSLRDDSAVREPETKVHVEAAGTALRELQTNINTTLTRTHYAAAAVCLAPRPAAAAAGRCPRNECCPLTHCGVACLHTPPNNPVGTYQVLAENMDCALFLCMTPSPQIQLKKLVAAVKVGELYSLLQTLSIYRSFSSQILFAGRMLAVILVSDFCLPFCFSSWWSHKIHSCTPARPLLPVPYEKSHRK